MGNTPETPNVLFHDPTSHFPATPMHAYEESTSKNNAYIPRWRGEATRSLGGSISASEGYTSPVH